MPKGVWGCCLLGVGEAIPSLDQVCLVLPLLMFSPANINIFYIYKPYWVELFPLLQIHSPGTCECDFIWKQGLCRCEQVILVTSQYVRSYWIQGWPWTQYDWCASKEREIQTRTHTQREYSQGQRLELWRHKPHCMAFFGLWKRQRRRYGRFLP